MLSIKDYSYGLHKLGGEVTYYEIADEDVASDPMYFGYLNAEGFWIIQQRTISTGAYRYASGRVDYDTAWTGRAALSYGHFNTIH